MNETFKFSINVRFRDIDGMGHVNNAVFFTYFAEGRMAFFKKISIESGFPAFTFILAHISCDYLRPVTMDTHLLLEIRVREIGVKSFGLAYKLVDASNVSVMYADGQSVQVCFDYAENKSISVPAAIRQKLIEYRVIPSQTDA